MGTPPNHGGAPTVRTYGPLVYTDLVFYPPPAGHVAEWDNTHTSGYSLQPLFPVSHKGGKIQGLTWEPQGFFHWAIPWRALPKAAPSTVWPTYGPVTHRGRTAPPAAASNSLYFTPSQGSSAFGGGKIQDSPLAKGGGGKIQGPH